MTLTPALTGERRETTGRAGRLSFYVAGNGPPMLLVHSLNAAGSAYEIRPIYDAMRDTHRVYAPDLPGFGFSDRSPRPYSIRMFVEAVHDMLDVIAADVGPQPVEVLGLSLGAEFVARAANEQPDRVNSLALVTPTGFGRAYKALRGLVGETREVKALYGFLNVPLWSDRLYKLLIKRGTIRFFLQRTYGSKDIDEDLLDYDYQTAHQPDAKNAPYAFVSGRLFSKDIRTVYERLSLPIWMPHGTKGDFGDFSQADWVRARANWRVQAWETGALPHFERPGPFMAAYRDFLATVARSGVAAGALAVVGQSVSEPSSPRP